LQGPDQGGIEFYERKRKGIYISYPALQLNLIPLRIFMKGKFAFDNDYR
jgi:hypothetical protein